MSKIYECCICHKVLTDRKPIRLVKQLYGGKYNQYHTVEHYDICRACYRAFDSWIFKHRKEEVESD